jgi:uncharacterized protein YndB with AHSA1/START domain
MKKPMLIVAVVVVGITAILTALAVATSFRPDEMNVSRSTTIAAPPEAIFKVVNDLHQWDAWSPWSKLDPAMKVSYAGPAEGVGSSYHWSGNSDVGEGTSTIVESKPSEKVGMRLEMVRPMAGSNDVQFTFVPEGTGTKVTWAMHGKVPFIGKVVGLFMDCEKMCGDQFNEGLANLKRVVEAAPRA